MSELVAGVGMVRFSKPGAQEAYPVMASEAIRVALGDAGLGLEDVAQAYAGYCYGATTCGQRALYEVGMTGIPVINVRNACATGSSALLLANQAVASGAVDVALAFGFEEMKPGALVNEDFRVSPVDRIVARFNELGYPVDEAMSAPGFFGAAGQEYLSRYDAKADIFAKVAVKTRTHAANNPMALFTKPITVDFKRGADGKGGQGKTVGGGEARFTIKRSDYDMKFMEGPLGDEVNIILSLEGAKQ